MFKWIGGLVDRVFALVGAVIISQAPLFMDQYQQQLTGHIAELRIQVSVIQQAAKQSGKTVEQFVQKFLLSGDVDFVRQGEIIQEMIERLQSLSSAQQSVNTSTVFMKPFVFVRHMNWDVANSTAHKFIPGLAFSLEGLIYAFIGLILGYLFFRVIKHFVCSFFTKKTMPTNKTMISSELGPESQKIDSQKPESGSSLENFF